MTHECTWCGEVTDSTEDVCSPGCAEAQAHADREAEWTEEERVRDAKRRMEERGRAWLEDREVLP